MFFEQQTNEQKFKATAQNYVHSQCANIKLTQICQLCIQKLLVCEKPGRKAPSWSRGRMVEQTPKRENSVCGVMRGIPNDFTVYGTMHNILELERQIKYVMIVST